MKKLTLVLFIIIVGISAVLRLYQLGNIPISPDWDEVAIGYNAYSILQTGRDEFGEFLPVVIKSFGDYKPALYVYLAIPFVKLFGLTSLAVRLPSAILGIVSVIAVFYLVRVLFKKDSIAILTAFLLAISPWHIQFSRVGFEAQAGLVFNVLAALFFIKGLKKSWFLSLSAIFGALSLYTYQSEKVFTPIFMLLLVVVYRNELFRIGKKYLILAFATGFIFSLPLLTFMYSNTDSIQRAKATSIFNKQDFFLQENSKALLRDKADGNYLGLVLNNRRVVYAREIIGGYLSHYDVNFLLNGDIPRHHAPNMGLVYILEIPFLLLGIYLLIFGKFEKKTKLIIFSWFFLAPIPASVTTDVPHAVRVLNILPTFQIFTALGILYVYKKVSSIKYQVLSIKISHLLLVVFCFFPIFNFLYFLNQYFVQQNYFYASYWQYGYEEAVKSAEELKEEYKKIVVAEGGEMDKSYMFFLFYTKFDPFRYQELVNKSENNGILYSSFDKYEFRKFDLSKEKDRENTLYVGASEDFDGQENFKILKKIKYPNADDAIVLLEK